MDKDMVGNPKGMAIPDNNNCTAASVTSLYTKPSQQVMWMHTYTDTTAVGCL